MEQKVFKELLARYLENSCTREEKEIVDEWFAAIKRGEPDRLSVEEEELLFEAYQRDFEKTFRKKETSTILFRPHRRLWSAAVVLIMLAPLLYLVVLSQESPEGFAMNDTGATTIVNTKSSALLVPLSAGSKVVLNPGAAVTFSSRFTNGIREVSMEGEAFFDVAKDSLSPFVVKTGRLVAKVLGTSFTVKANKQDENIVVTVKTGKVSVQEAASDSGGEVLTQNQQAIYNITRRSIFRRELQAPPVPTARNTMHQERFTEAPVVEILRAMERIYGTRITLSQGDLKGCLLSTSVHTGEDLFKRLDIICMAIGATYKVDGVSIVISGKSCEAKDEPIKDTDGAIN